MKRKILFVVIVFAIATVCVSCSGTQKCPAYSQNNISIEQNS
ncbi:MAG: hypothetical protein V2I54_05040 [Bacteroidales bacterium]|nr:hypothetical protein [Bacteroidales bacterium]